MKCIHDREEDGNLQETKQSTFLTVTRPPTVVRSMVNDSLERGEDGMEKKVVQEW